MKTTNLDEIVFRDRNKSYGAYELRKRYDKTVIISFLVALFIVSGIVGVPMVQAMRNKHKIAKLDNNVIFDPGTFAKPDDPLPPPPPPPPPQPLLQKIAYTVPNVVDTTLDEPNILTIEEALDNDKSQPMPDIIVINPNHGDGIPDETEPITFFPSEYATFEGGDLESFTLWVNKNIVYPEEAAKNEIAGKVYVQFCINKKGEMVDIKIVRSVHQSIDEETLRVLKMSPKWNPAKQGGNPVKQLFTMKVNFVIH